MSKTAITTLKLARYPELLSGPVRPIHWDVDPSTVCDHRCRGCPYIFDGDTDPMLGVRRPAVAKSERTLLDFAKFVTFLADAREHGAQAITFVGGGEPTMHPHFAAMLRATQSYGIKFGVVTHLGRDYDEYTMDALSLATWVRVSMNAARRETYLKHQGKDHFGNAFMNLATLADRGTRVGVSFLITNDNYHEIVEAAVLAKRGGAAFIQFKPIIEVGEIGRAYKGLEHAILDALDEARTVADEDFQVLSQWGARLRELQHHQDAEFKGPCHVPRFNPKLGANGVVYTCCELAYSDEAALGSIYEEPLATILERAGQRCGTIDMRNCPHCWNKPVNKAINEGTFGDLEPPAESVDQEFV